MKTTKWRWGLLGLLMLTGCVVRSIYPWAASAINEPLLVGAWQDDEAEIRLQFDRPDQAGHFDVTMTDRDGKEGLLRGFLFRSHQLLLLDVTARPRETVEDFASFPGHLLLKIELQGEGCKIFEIDRESFGARLLKSDVPRLAEGSAKEGYGLTASTEALKKFLDQELPDPRFFKKEPLYTLVRTTDVKAAVPPRKGE